MFLRTFVVLFLVSSKPVRPFPLMFTKKLTTNGPTARTWVGFANLFANRFVVLPKLVFGLPCVLFVVSKDISVEYHNTLLYYIFLLKVPVILTLKL